MKNIFGNIWNIFCKKTSVARKEFNQLSKTHCGLLLPEKKLCRKTVLHMETYYSG